MDCFDFGIKKNGHFEIVRFLIENGADVNVKYKDEKTLLFLALERRFLEIAQLLIENGADVDEKPTE